MFVESPGIPDVEGARAVLDMTRQYRRVVQVGFLLRAWDIQRAEEFLADIARSRPFGLATSEVYAIESLGLLDYFGRILDDGHRPDSFLASRYRPLIERTVARAVNSAEAS